MTVDSRTPNSAPRKALSASLAASTPLAGASRRSEGLPGALRAVQRLAVAPAPVWSDSCAADPEPTPDDDGPWCSSLAPEPCDTGQPAATPVAPLGWRDLAGQISADELILRPMNTLTTQGGWL